MKDSESNLLAPLYYGPVTQERWEDLEALFGERGASSGCWCMWWRITRSQFSREHGAENRRALKAIVDSGKVPGILAYAAGEPVAWCSLGPREAYPSLERSTTLKRIDDEHVWSVVCFFVAKPFRGRGVMAPLLNAAVGYARDHGARIVEGYPVKPQARLSSASAYTGVATAFRKVGFREVDRPPGTRLIMRYFMEGS